MAILDVDARLAVAKEILRYCGVPDKDQDQRFSEKDWEWWSRTEDSKFNSEERLINDAIHGPIELTPLLYQIINTREFHRLKDIKQLGAANYVYPSANHTRFDHSIGVCYLAGEFAYLLKQKIEKDVEHVPDDEKYLWTFTEEEVLCTRVAGLCHDLGYGPFSSHMFEHMIIKDPKANIPPIKHEQLSTAIFKHLLVNNVKVLFEFVKANLGVEHVKKIEDMIHPPKRKDVSGTNADKRQFLYEIVANKQSGVDVDKWDYYTRDCFCLGVSHDFQWKRCMLLGRVVKANEELHIAFRDKELDNLYGMFRIRCHLRQIAYQHKTSKAVERMYSDAILFAKDLPIIGTRLKVMNIQTALLEAVNVIKKGGDALKLEGYLTMTDSLAGIIKNALYRELHESKTFSDEHRKGLNLLERIEQRDLYCLSARTLVQKKLSCEDEHILLEKILVHLSPDETRYISKDDLWIQVVRFELASEKTTEDPVREILFYKKQKRTGPAVPLSQLSLDMASKLLVPQVFVEYEIRIYDKRSESVRGFEDQLSSSLQLALDKWRKTL